MTSWLLAPPRHGAGPAGWVAGEAAAGAEGSLPLTPNGTPKTPQSPTAFAPALCLQASSASGMGGALRKAPTYLMPSERRCRPHLGEKGVFGQFYQELQGRAVCLQCLEGVCTPTGAAARGNP